MADPYVGEIRSFGFDFAPEGWLKCDGGTYPIRDYNALYALIGTIYGGDGSNNFMVPDLRGRVYVNQGQAPGLSNYVIGQAQGTEQNVLQVANLPSHSHGLLANSTEATTDNPAGAALANARSNTYIAQAPDTPMIAGSISPVGSGSPIDNRQPFLVTNFAINFNGIFPDRS